jgi:hypothetical protein
VEAPSNPHGCRPRETAEHVEAFDTLGEAIESVPGFIEDHYSDK